MLVCKECDRQLSEDEEEYAVTNNVCPHCGKESLEECDDNK